MNALRRASRDPWWDDGTGVRKARTRRRTMSYVALCISIVAVGLTIAAWINTLAPMFTPLGFG